MGIEAAYADLVNEAELERLKSEAQSARDDAALSQLVGDIITELEESTPFLASKDFTWERMSSGGKFVLSKRNLSISILCEGAIAIHLHLHKEQKPRGHSMSKVVSNTSDMTNKIAEWIMWEESR